MGANGYKPLTNSEKINLLDYQKVLLIKQKLNYLNDKIS